MRTYTITNIANWLQEHLPEFKDGGRVLGIKETKTGLVIEADTPEEEITVTLSWNYFHDKAVSGGVLAGGLTLYVDLPTMEEELLENNLLYKTCRIDFDSPENVFDKFLEPASKEPKPREYDFDKNVKDVEKNFVGTHAQYLEAMEKAKEADWKEYVNAEKYYFQLQEELKQIQKYYLYHYYKKHGGVDEFGFEKLYSFFEEKCNYVFFEDWKKVIDCFNIWR